MNTVTVSYNISSSPNDITFVADPILLKGSTTLSVSLTGVSESDFRVDLLTINWGDSSKQETYKRDVFFNYRTSSIFNEVLYGKLGGSILGVYNHDYRNQSDSYEAIYTLNVVIQKNNGKYVYIEQPVRCYWSSFYDSLSGLSILDMQVLPLTGNSGFVSLEGGDGSIFAANL
jgi:hypothetical protein